MNKNLHEWGRAANSLFSTQVSRTNLPGAGAVECPTPLLRALAEAVLDLSYTLGNPTDVKVVFSDGTFPLLM